MNKIFSGIGILVALFSIFFFFLVADKMVFQQEKTFYNFILDQFIPAENLEKIAEEIDVTIRLVEFENTSFGEKNEVVTFINPDKRIKMGKQDSVFPNNNIVFHKLDQDHPINIQYFSVQSDDSNKIKKLKSTLENEKFTMTVQKNQPIRFSIGMLFSSLNLGFFSLLTLLLILCIATYYIHRLKEIGVLKLNGWVNIRITVRLLLNMAISLYSMSLVCMVPFSIYVYIRDRGIWFTYLKIYFLLCFFLLFVFSFSAVFGMFFVATVNRVNAIKNKKNNQLVFYTLLLFKITTTVLLAVSVNHSISNIDSLVATVQAVDKLQGYQFYKIRTAVTPEEEVRNKITEIIASLDDSSVYNYGFPEHLFNIEKMNKIRSKGGTFFSDNLSFTQISANMLEAITLYDTRGSRIEPEQMDADSDTLLIPIHYKGKLKEILKDYQFDIVPKIIYIQNGQSHNDIIYPSLYVYDSIYYIHKLQKVLYLNSGEVLLNKHSAKQVRESFQKLGLDSYSINVESAMMDYNNIKANNQLDLYESSFQVVINLSSYLLCTIAVVTIFLELRKKEFGVYRLVGRVPKITILRFLCMTISITFVVALCVNRVFLLLILIEGVLYIFIMTRYLRYKAVLTIKGE